MAIRNFAILSVKFQIKTIELDEILKKLSVRTFLGNLYGFGDIRTWNLCFDAFIFITTVLVIVRSSEAKMKADSTQKINSWK